MDIKVHKKPKRELIWPHDHLLISEIESKVYKSPQTYRMKAPLGIK